MLTSSYRMHELCPSCCVQCRSQPPQSTSSSAQNPFDLIHLQKAGVLTIQLGHNVDLHSWCQHRHDSDGWHPFTDAAPFMPLTSLSDVDLCKELEFLVRHRFLSATYRRGEEGKLLIRLYLIPYDLAGAKGSLRVRPDNVLVPARRYQRQILAKVSKGPEIWEGRDSEEFVSFLDTSTDPRTLAEIYSDLESPKAMPVPGLGDISQRLLNPHDNLDGLGLRTSSKLYKYQRHSVAAMLQRELDRRDVPDPLFIPMTAVDGRGFFLQPGTMEVLLERPRVAPCQGGILCEELGSGKTVMIIALVLATLRQLPQPEESLVDARPVLTPLSLRHFPSLECMTARTRISYKGKERACRVPSLVELLLDSSRTSPCDAVPNLTTTEGCKKAARLEYMEENFESLPLAQLRDACPPFYFQYPGDPSDFDRDRRKRSTSAPKRMYLSAATLVVVPPNLLGQWDREITKHSEDSLRVLILRDRSDMPTVKELASNYDIILMTYTRFTIETKQQTSRLHTTKPCTCPEIPSTSIPDCQCFISDVSPLLQIRWKRLIIDEGHVSASLTTDLVPCTKALSVQCRWIVTGTPTTNLLGLALGQRTVEDVSDQPVAESNDTDVGHDIYMFDAPQVSPTTSVSSQASSLRSTPSPSNPPKARIWDRDDRGDLRKLGNMIAHFIAVPQFAGDSKLMATHVTDALLDPNGPRPGAIRVLNQVMQMVMIRHRIEDIENDVILPPLTHESVLLDMDTLAIKSYNALQASIAVNAVDSERKDQDYLFHPRNADLLQVLVKNMSQTMFYSIDDNMYNVDELCRNAHKIINRAIERNRPPEDIELLNDAIRHLMIAAQDPLWRQIHGHEDVPYRVYSCPTDVFGAWTRAQGTGNEVARSNDFNGFLSADRLLGLYQHTLERPLTSVQALVEEGTRIAQKDAELRQAYLASQEKKSVKAKGGSSRLIKDREGNETKITGEDVATHSQIAAGAVKRASAKETMDAVKAELKTSMARLEAEAEAELSADSTDGPLDAGKAKGNEKAPKDAGGLGVETDIQRSTKLSVLAHNSPLAHTRVGSSLSNKLNYIIDQVLKYSKDEKFLIFTDSELTLAHIGEAMDLIRVRHLRFSAQIPPRHREQLVLTFETSQTFRVLLMELKHGARGLNLVSASRVIFCEPVWQADVESQAIKRAHRIGQTRPITVKTLAIRGTAEENMVIRRNALQQISHEKLPKLIEEAGMRHFISNPKFIETTPTVIDVNFPLLDLPPVDLSQSVTLKLKRPQPPTPDATTSPKKSKRKVWLMDPMSGHDAVAPPPNHDLKRPRTIRFAT